MRIWPAHCEGIVKLRISHLHTSRIAVCVRWIHAEHDGHDEHDRHQRIDCSLEGWQAQFREELSMLTRLHSCAQLANQMILMYLSNEFRTVTQLPRP